MYRRLTPLVLSLLIAAAALGTGPALLGPAAAQPLSGEASSSTAEPERKRSSPWRLVFRDRFSGTSLDTDKWGVYTGGQRRAENVIVSDGKLALRTKRVGDSWTYAGISSARALKLTHGKFMIRARLDPAQGTRAVALLWPAAKGVWPPEIDFFEVAGDNPARTKNLTANHYLDNGAHKIQHALVQSDYTEWHRIGVIWKPRALRFVLDGEVVAIQRGHVPQQDMWLGLQTALGTGDGAPNASTPGQVDFDVDWVKVHTRRR